MIVYFNVEHLADLNNLPIPKSNLVLVNSLALDAGWLGTQDLQGDSVHTTCRILVRKLCTLLQKIG
jgi:hypothetical protein